MLDIASFPSFIELGVNARVVEAVAVRKGVASVEFAGGNPLVSFRSSHTLSWPKSTSILHQSVIAPLW